MFNVLVSINITTADSIISSHNSSHSCPFKLNQNFDGLSVEQGDSAEVEIAVKGSSCQWGGYDAIIAINASYFVVNCLIFRGDLSHNNVHIHFLLSSLRLSSNALAKRRVTSPSRRRQNGERAMQARRHSRIVAIWSSFNSREILVSDVTRCCSDTVFIKMVHNNNSL